MSGSPAAKQLKWRDVVHLQPRYRRSVHLERDFATKEALAGYVVTPLVRATLGRVADGLTGSGSRAWSFTGPYGSGKSAFAVFLAQLFHHSHSQGGPARQMLEEVEPDLYRRLFAGKTPSYLVPVLATGDRNSLEAVVLRALDQAASSFWDGRGRRPKLAAEITKAAVQAERGDRIGPKQVVQYVERFAEKLADSKRRGAGVLLLIDEAGKALEYAAHHPDRADVHLLQELAELATRSGDCPIVVGVLLHQSFDQYASRLGTTQRNEWAKVQGRFENVPFLEAADQILRLIALALNLGELPPTVKRELRPLIDDAVAAVSLPGMPDKAHLARLLGEMFPLHPITALLLGPVFRSHVSQNERSLFAFLSSAEPGAFQSFLDAPVVSGGVQTYRPHHLFDYLSSAFGERLYRQGRGWALINDALSRLPKDATELDAKIVKTVGVLGLLPESAGIPASDRVLELAVSDGQSERKHVTESLKRLQAASVLVYRRFRDSYQVWDGSDLHLDDRLRTAAGQLDPRTKLVDLLNKAVPPRPIVARRHLFQSGTLRYFEVRYGDETVLDGEWAADGAQADGVVWLVVPSTDEAALVFKARLNKAETWLGHGESSKPVIFGVMDEAGRLREAAVELAALDWVRAHTPELSGDPVARKELEGRTVDAENTLRQEMSAFVNGDREAIWNYQGTSLYVRNGRHLSAELSTICDQCYAKAPRIFNELINRSKLSSAAAGARNQLLIAMIEKSRLPRLGIEGAPPELSMYRSILEKHGMHRPIEGGVWGYGNPSNQEGSPKAALREIVRVVGGDGTMTPLRRVYEALSRPPFGIKEEVIPVLLLWVLLKHETEMALYEEGSFIPAIDAPTIERLARRPEQFEIQRFRIDGAREAMLEELAPGEEGEQSPLALVREFMKVIQDIPPYSRNTREVSEAAQKVRDTILRAKEPGTLVFTDLPVACGHEPVPATRTAKLPKGLLTAIRSALKELQTAYPQLLSRIREMLSREFSLPADENAAKKELAARAKHLASVAADPQLKTFLVRVSDDAADLKAWTVSAATFLGGRPPETWSDPDVQRMSIQLSMVGRKFAALQAAFLEHQRAGLPEGAVAVRVAVTEAGQAESERVVLVRREEKAGVASVAERLGQAIQAERADSPPETVVAALGQLLRGLISEMDSAGTQTERSVGGG